MNARALAGSDIGAFVGRLLADHQVFGPKLDGTRVVYAPIERAGELVLRAPRPQNSVKELLLPQTLAMYRFKTGEEEPVLMSEEGAKRIVLGTRACDLRALSLMNQIFMLDERPDPTYARARDRTILFGLACPDMGRACFCNSLDIDRMKGEACDVLMTPLDDSYLLEAASERGAALIADLPGAAEAERERREELARKAARNGNSLVPVDRAVLALEGAFASGFWQEVSQGCAGCAICAFVCPTCHCFDITDEVGLGEVGRRIRTWDTCMAARFTRQASGYNPRPTQTERFRQRVLHKFQYLLRSRKLIGCTGCGRCVELCPVNLDIRSVLTQIVSRLQGDGRRSSGCA